MSWVRCCEPPEKVPYGVERSQIWQCPICGQWWGLYGSLSPERISRLSVFLFHFSQWRHWRKANNVNPRDLFDIP